MTRPLFASLLVVSLTLGGASRASAVDVPGGGPIKTDCAIGFQVEGKSNTNPLVVKPNRKVVDQLACNGSCMFDVNLCVNVPVTNCTPPAVSAITIDPAGSVEAPATLGPDRVCGATKTVPVPQSGKKKGKVKLVKKVTGTTSGKPDKDKLILRCLPNAANTGCGGTTASKVCPVNAAGGPDEAILTALATGTDLDSGWTGVSHNFPVIQDIPLQVCFQDCNGTDDLLCNATSFTGAGTFNEATFGPPLPLIAANVATCVTNTFVGNISGTVDLATGASASNVTLVSEVFITDGVRVCPRCETGTCSDGPNRGKPCTVHGKVRVQNSLADNKLFQLSRDCPPGAPGSGIARLNINLPVTTGTTATPGTGGSKPCREDEAKGVPVLDDNCGAGGCGTANCTGGACVSGSGLTCVDVKGGISTNCCNDSTSTPCFDTRPGRPGIVRSGTPVPALPAFPDQTYPKTADNYVQVATFCIAATGNASVDTVAGLPGPGAVTFSTRVEMKKNPAPATP